MDSLANLVSKLKNKLEKDNKEYAPNDNLVQESPLIFKDSVKDDSNVSSWKLPNTSDIWNKKSEDVKFPYKRTSDLVRESIDSLKKNTDSILESKFSGLDNTIRTKDQSLSDLSISSSPLVEPKPVEIKRRESVQEKKDSVSVGKEKPKVSINLGETLQKDTTSTPKKEHLIEIKRVFRGEDYTISKVYLDGEYFCDSLEDTDRDTNRNGVFDSNEQKIWGETAIPNGTYYLDWRYSPRFSSKFGNKMMPYIEGINGFSQVLFHHGNTKKDTHGCVLLGQNISKGRVDNSIATTKKFLEKTRPWINDKTIVKVG